MHNTYNQEIHWYKWPRGEVLGLALYIEPGPQRPFTTIVGVVDPVIRHPYLLWVLQHVIICSTSIAHVCIHCFRSLYLFSGDWIPTPPRARLRPVSGISLISSWRSLLVLYPYLPFDFLLRTFKRLLRWSEVSK